MQTASLKQFSSHLKKEQKKTKTFWADLGNLHERASIQEEDDKLKEAAKEWLDVFIAGETPTQPISLVGLWLKTTLELIPLPCPHNHTLSAGPRQLAWRIGLRAPRAQGADSLSYRPSIRRQNHKGCFKGTLKNKQARDIHCLWDFNWASER